MIVRHFLKWVRTAPAGERADATAALARAYLFSDLREDDRAAAEAALTLMLDDASPLVRVALAETFAAHTHAPRGIVLALAHDAPEVAGIVLAHSPVLGDDDLIETVATGEGARQVAVAERPWLSATLSAALAEIGSPEACLTLVENEGAEIGAGALMRVAERHGHLGAVKEALLERDDLPAAARHLLATRLADTLAAFVSRRDWLDEGRAAEIAREACERATIVIAHAADMDSALRLVRHLRDGGRLTAGLLLRALLCGNRTLLEAALTELSGLAPARVAAILDDRSAATFGPLYARAGLPASAEPLFRAALATAHEIGFAGDAMTAARLNRRMVERVLTLYRGGEAGALDGFLALLRRFAAEAAREEARAWTADLELAA